MPLNGEAQAWSEVWRAIAGKEPNGVSEVAGEHKSSEVPQKGAAKQ
jgi:hypothetical protein